MSFMYCFARFGETRQGFWAHLGHAAEPLRWLVACVGEVLWLTRASPSVRLPVRQQQSSHLTWLQTPPSCSNVFSGPVPRSPAPLPGPVLLAALVWCHPPSGTPVCGCPFRPIHSLASYCELSSSALPGAVVRTKLSHGQTA